MDIINDKRLPWIIAGILAVLLVIMTVLWANASGAFTLDADDLAKERERLSQACQTSEDLATPACRDALNDLERLLERFDNRLKRQQREGAQNPLDGATVEVSTSSATGGQ